MKLDSKKVLAVFFLFSIIAGGILTLALSPVRIFGGLVRGYLNAPEDDNVLQKVGGSFKEFDSRMDSYFVLHDLSIHTYGGIQRLLDRSLIYDGDRSGGLLKLNNGYLTGKQSSDYDGSDIIPYLSRLKKTCDSAGSKLLFVSKISKETTDPELLPDFYPYIFSSNFKEVKSELRAKGIKVLDLEESVVEQKLDKYSLFFRTDHHWTPETGVWAGKTICESINGYYGWKLKTDTLDLNNFNIKVYKQSFLGTEGKPVGALYSGVDDFEVITPEFDTNFSVEIGDIDFKNTGSFADCFIHEESITPNDLLNPDDTAYDAYMRGNHDLVKITNNNIKSGKSALFVQDSYGCVVAPYLALMFEHLECVDIRGFSESIEEYIKTTSPDIVIYAIPGHQ